MPTADVVTFANRPLRIRGTNQRDESPKEEKTLTTSKQTKSASDSRRDFLKLATAGTAAAVVATGVGAKPTQAAISPRDVGYAETDHVRTYYESCRF